MSTRLLTKRLVLLFIGASFTSTAFMNCSSGQFETMEQASNSLSVLEANVDLSFNEGVLDTLNADSVAVVPFSVVASNSNYKIKCYLNGVEVADCKSPISLESMTDGDQTIRIVAENLNSKPLREISRVIRLDRKPPVISVTSKPAAQIGETSTMLQFSVMDAVSPVTDIVVECSMDNAAFAACVSPKVFSSLAMGAHNIKLRARDKAGNLSAATSIDFSVVLGVPSVVISVKPNDFSNNTTASFTFSATSAVPITGYECSLDNGAYAACVSPKVYTGLTNKAYSFNVRATDANNQVSSVNTAKFTVDTTAPAAPNVSSNLMSPTKTTALSLVFSSTDSSGIARFQCSQDNGAYSACTSPKSVIGLTSDTHTFKVKAEDMAGNVSAEGTYTIVVDTAAPVLSIGSKPANPTVETSASFTFTATDSLSGVGVVECQLDTEAAYSACTSPKNYSGIGKGNRTFSLRVTDKAGNTAMQTYTWVVNEIPVADGNVPAIDPAGVFDGKGGVNATAYRTIASQYGTAAMIPFRFGKDSSYYNPGGVSAPTAWERPIQFYKNPTNQYETKYYNLGTPVSAAGDFSSNQAQVAYVTDTAVPISNPGVDRIATLQMDHLIFSLVPQLSWAESFQGRPDQNLKKQAFKNVNTDGKPIEVARALGASEYAGQALTVFQNGVITAGGINTASDTNIYYKPFPSNYVPTAAAVTSSGEFALITIWDTQNLKAKLAVIALGGSRPTGEFWDYEFNETYPGFRNYSFWTFAKLLGYVDLPDMIAPTAVEAVGNIMIGNGISVLPGNKQPANFLLTNQSNWNCFVSGECQNYYQRRGFAVVSSRYEKKVSIVDLTPLFQKIKKGMFTDWSTFRANVANTGMGSTQWPQTFDVDSSAMPKVTKTLAFDQQVTAISTSLWADNWAFVATEDGVVHVYDVDGLQTGTGSGVNVKEIRSYQVGRNVTRLAHMKHVTACCGDGAEIRWQMVTMSRGDKRVDWIDMKQNKIIRTMRDSRMADPISVEDQNNHGTESHALLILDYSAKKVRSYRYGPVIFHTEQKQRFDMGPNGTDPYEYSGDYDTPTGPFCISVENVT